MLSFRSLGNSTVFSVRLKRWYNILTVNIALVFNIFGGIFSGVVAFFKFKFFISFSISDWETSVNENLFPWHIFFRLSEDLMSFKLCYRPNNKL